MSLRVRKVAELVGKEIVITAPELANVFLAVLDNLENCEGSGQQWSFSLVLGEGPARRIVPIELARFVSNTAFEKSVEAPLLMETSERLALFQRNFFWADPSPKSDAEREEFILRVKQAVYRDREEITPLRSYVSNIEAAIEYQRTGPKRDPIPDDVKLLVWNRDGGVCIRCGSWENLQFDYVIPVAIGGGSNAENIQLLCEPCKKKV